jgi:membrane protease YdiL (CAAX protease family)
MPGTPKDNEMSMLKRYQLAAYFFLVFVISWGAILVIIGPSGLPAPADQAQTIGMALLLGPARAMLMITAVVGGREGFRELWSHIKRWRIGGGNLAVALLAAPVSAIATLLVLSLFSEQFTPKIFVADGKLSLLLTGIGAGLFIAIFEELGWTGFAVPRLLKTHSVLGSGVIVGLLWGLWHFPPFWQGDSFSAGMPLLLLLARLFSWIVAFRVMMVWLYTRTDSVPAVIIMHTSLVFCMIAIEPPLKGSALLTYILSWTVVLWMVVWIGSSLCRKNEKRSLQ